MKASSTKTEMFINSIIEGQSETFYNGFYKSLCMTKNFTSNLMHDYVTVLNEGGFEMFKSEDEIFETMNQNTRELISIGFILNELFIKSIENEMIIDDYGIETYSRAELFEQPIEALKIFKRELVFVENVFKGILKKFNASKNNCDVNALSYTITYLNQVTDNISTLNEIIREIKNNDKKTSNDNYKWN